MEAGLFEEATGGPDCWLSGCLAVRYGVDGGESEKNGEKGGNERKPSAGDRISGFLWRGCAGRSGQRAAGSG